MVLVPFGFKPLLFRGRVGEIALVQLGLFADLAGTLFLGFASDRYLLFAGQAWGLLNGITAPMIRSLVSKHAAQDQQVRECS